MHKFVGNKVKVTGLEQQKPLFIFVSFNCRVTFIVKVVLSSSLVLTFYRCSLLPFLKANCCIP